MPDPIVVVEISSQERAQQGAALLLEACSSALRRGRCVARDPGQGESVRAVAIVGWASHDLRKVRIEVGIRVENRADWRTRELEFRTKDKPNERWRAAGLTVATLVGEIDPDPDPTAPTSPSASATASTESPIAPPSTSGSSAAIEPPPPENSSRAAPPVAPEMAQGFVDATLVAGVATQGGEPRRGGGIRAGIPLMRGLRALVAASYLGTGENTTGVSAQWLTLGLGVGAWWRWTGPSIELSGRGEGVLVRERASVNEAGTGASDAAGRWIPGLRMGLELSWPADRWWAVVGAAEGTWLTVAEPVRVRGIERERLTALGGDGVLGFRVRW